MMKKIHFNAFNSRRLGGFTRTDGQSSFANLQASQQLLSATAAAVQSSQKRYDKGAADILELLTMQSALADAQQERVRCLSDWRSARLRLMSSAGMLGRDGLTN